MIWSLERCDILETEDLISGPGPTSYKQRLVTSPPQECTKYISFIFFIVNMKIMLYGLWLSNLCCRLSQERAVSGLH